MNSIYNYFQILNRVMDVLILQCGGCFIYLLLCLSSHFEAVNFFQTYQYSLFEYLINIFFSGQGVLKKWTNLRDSFSKYFKKDKECKRSGSGAKKIKKYLYFDQLQFLKIFMLSDRLRKAKNRNRETIHRMKKMTQSLNCKLQIMFQIFQGKNQVIHKREGKIKVRTTFI